jgi:hypothetical protein
VNMNGGMFSSFLVHAVLSATIIAINFKLISGNLSIYVFDALVIFPVVALYVYWHPGKYLPHMEFILPKHAR